MAKRFPGPLIGGMFRVVGTILLVAIYVAVFVPGGLLLRIVRIDPLTRKWDPNASSYWRSIKAGR